MSYSLLPVLYINGPGEERYVYYWCKYVLSIQHGVVQYRYRYRYGAMTVFEWIVYISEVPDQYRLRIIIRLDKLQAFLL